MSALIPSTAICVGVILPVLYFGARRRPGLLSHKHVYQDEDGEASTDGPEGTRDRASRTLIFVLALGALGLSVMNWILPVMNTRLGIITIGWTIVNISVVLLALEPTYERRFTIGISIAASALALSLELVIDDYSNITNKVACWYQFALGLCLVFVSCSLRRRPTLYFEGQEVDGQLTCSVLQRCTFAWVRPLLDQARKLHSTEYNDLAVLGHALRSHNLKIRFSMDQSKKRPLWRSIIRDHQAAILQQYLTAVVESVVSIFPPVCMYKILSLLEERSFGHSSDHLTIWFWVACLAGSKVTHVGLSNWLQWVSFGIFALPVRSQLSAVIFAKSLEMKSVQSVYCQTRQPSSDSSAGEGEAHETDALLPQEEITKQEQESDDAEADQGPAKGIVNLLGVDVQRVALFCGYSQDLLRGFVKVVIAAILLATLLGWWSTLAGFAVPVIMQPLNQVATKYYTRRQLEIMAARDNKAHVVTEALQGIRQVKFSATELQWEKRILEARERELQAQWNVYLWGIFLTFTWIAMPAMMGAAALSVYAYSSEQMIPSVAFTALSIFSSLEWTIGAVPITITEMLDARVSADRIQQHLDTEERLGMLKQGSAVEFKDATIAWPSRSQSAQHFALRALNFRFPPDKLSVIHGETGSGKSLLLAAILGEADLLGGEVQVPRAHPMSERDSEHASMDNWIIPSALAYVGQVPWIENASVKDTILYGLPYHHERYMQVVRACALLDDIKMLPDGEDTEVGATGINLSGGQRWRLTFARALYSRAGVLVLDDIFSAVDSHVGHYLLDHGILGPLGANRTKILVTHHVGLVERYAACIVTLSGDGTTKFTENPTHETATISDHEAKNSEATQVPGTIDEDHEANSLSKAEARKFVKDEERAQGRVSWKVYKMYLLASGGAQYWILAFVIFSLAALSTVARSFWLVLWTKTYATDHVPHSDTTRYAGSETHSQPHLLFYLSIYILISLVSISLVAIKITFVLLASLRAARHLFEVVTQNVLRAQLRWLDTQPLGRILNRFVGDFSLIDSGLGGDMTWCANGLFSIVTIIAAALFVSAWMLVPIFILSLLCIYIAYLYLDAARDIKRLESSAKSPMFELVGTTLSGLATIRSFGRVDYYLSRMNKHIDRYAQSSWYVLLATQWMNFRQGLLGVLFTLCIAAGVTYFPSINPSLAGFALSFALDFSGVVQVTVNKYTSLELDMNSTERVLEYMQLDTEPLSGADPGTNWPSKGQLVVRDLEVGYAKDLESVLKGVSFSVQPRQRIGIVGRTGSGKSSLTLALFRFLEARRGSIEIDGVDLKTLKLVDVRGRLAIIPQDPVLFSGTLRSNLDPFQEHSNASLLEALERVTPASSLSRATPHRSNIFTNLASPIARSGSNLSQGEKQLVCLARAIITRPKVVVLDEATSAVDMATDALIQRSIREEFRDSTLLVVAHRLSTVADFDKILVMSDGKIAEYDEPMVLAKKKGLFWNMLIESGEREALKHLLT